MTKMQKMKNFMTCALFKKKKDLCNKADSPDCEIWDIVYTSNVVPFSAFLSF